MTSAIKDLARQHKSGEQPTSTTDSSCKTEKIDLSVVIPIYNEEKRIVNTVSLINEYLSKQDCLFEVIISDDGSRDGGPRLVRDRFTDNRRVRLLRDPKNNGKGAAVRRGVLAARGDLIIFMDADLSYPVETIEQCMAELESYDIAIGSRNLSGSLIEISPTWLRRLTGPVFKSIVRSLVLKGFTDTQCGFKGFRSQAAHDIFINCKTNGFAFDVEVLAIARRFGYSITEMPVRLQVDSSDSQINLTTDAASMVLELLAIRRRMRKWND